MKRWSQVGARARHAAAAETPHRPLRRTARPRRPHRIGWRAGAAVVVAVSVGIVGAVAGPASADDYPTWQDVQKAKQSQAATAKELSRINGLISGLESKAKAAQAEAEKRGKELQKAREAFDAADIRARNLSDQAAAGEKKAQEATQRVGRLAAQLYRTGGNLGPQLILSGSRDTGELLAKLGSMSQLLEHNNDVYDQAVTAKNTAEALSEQAQVAKKERERLRQKAESALQAAARASEKAQAQLEKTENHVTELKAQLAALKDKTAKTVKGYQKGVAARKAAAEAARKAAAEAARKRAAQAAGSTGSGAGLPGGWVGSQGWAVPVRGVITSGFGGRQQPCAICSGNHMGIDIANGYGTTEYAAHDGVVVYAGWLGGYGNAIMLDVGNGIRLVYGHIRNGGIFVTIGQRVVAGEAIASMGSTGASTGYHLHFEVRVNGSAVDGIPFMRQRGAPLG